MTDADRTYQAQLRDMPMEQICVFLRSQGHGDIARLLHGRITGAPEEDDEEGVIAVFLRDALPPRAEDDAPLPFEVL